MPRKLYINDAGLNTYCKLVTDYMKINYDVERTLEEMIAKVTMELKLAVMNDKIRTITVREDGTIVIKTEELILTEPRLKRHFFVGAYEIACTYRGSFKFKSISQYKSEISFHSSCWGVSTIHPHIKSTTGKACLGNAETPLILFIRQGEIRAVISMLIGYLETANINDSAGRFVGCLPEIELDESGKPVVIDAEAETLREKYKILTNEFDDEESDNHRAIIEITHDNKYGTYSSKYCECCGDFYNRKDITTHIPGYGYVCNRCKENITICDCCGSRVNRDDSYEINDLLLCESCYNNTLRECVQCGTVLNKTTKADLENERSFNKASIIRNNIYGMVTTVVTDDLEKKDICVCNNCKATINNNPVYGSLLNKVTTVSKYKIDISNTLSKYKSVKCQSCGTWYAFGKLYKTEDGRYICSHCATGIVSGISNREDTVVVMNGKIGVTTGAKEIMMSDTAPNIYPKYIFNKDNIKEEILNECGI